MLVTLAARVDNILISDILTLHTSRQPTCCRHQQAPAAETMLLAGMDAAGTSGGNDEIGNAS